MRYYPLNWVMGNRYGYFIGYLSPESDWPTIQETLVDAMTRLENALKPALDTLKL